MIRYRRYRAYVVFAVISILALYEFSGFTNWNVASAIGAGSLKQSGLSQDPTPQDPAGNADGNSFQASPDVAQSEKPKEEEKIEVPPPAPTKQAAPVTTPFAESLEQAPSSISISTTATQTIELITPHNTLEGSLLDSAPVHELDDIAEVGEGRMEVIAPPEGNIPAIHWSKQPEHFPVETTIQLPSGTPLPIPRIQYKFGSESPSQLAARKEKLKVISDAVVHSWTGYKEKAWMKDEVRPVTGGSRDPFCGWAATLVDALDTLWIVGLKDEFEAAVKAVGDIDFTTSQRKDIPVFETTIRYLGGLLSAYDLSGGQYKILLDKAVELAEILMGAFDTPNRMPATFYRWMPTFASQPHRAGTHVVLAEIGSLSMEFTRLAQLTREPKFYDAIDRITDAFLEWQSASGINATLVPGLFPTHVDASGCEKPAQIKTHKSHYAPYAAEGGAVAVGDSLGVKAGKPVTKQQGSLPTLPSKTTDADTSSQLSEKAGSKPPQQDSSSGNKGKIIGWDDPIREGDLDSKQAKAAVLNNAVDGNILRKRQLGGLDDDDEKTVDAKALAESIAQQETAAKKKILDKAVCIPRGLASSNSYGSDSFTIGGMADSLYEYFPKEYLLLGGLEDKYKVLYEKSMDAVIAKLLFRPMIPDETDILFAGEFQAHSGSDQAGRNGKLTPEGAHLTCFAGGMFALGAKIFNRKEDLDYGRRLTEGCVWAYNATNTGIMPEGFYLSMCESMDGCPWNQTKYYEELDPYGYIRDMDNANLNKRQLDDDIRPASPVVDVESAVPNSVPEPALHSVPTNKPYKAPEQPSHEEFVLARIQDERLPPGITRITSRKYILRPEAIESVFYMYRITGEEHWREVGWQMFEAVHKHTFATFGASAIDDVTKEIPGQEDSEESFWLAETLKYFFLLFSDPDTVSLDEWVLNTEAHPFKRPSP